MLLYLFVLGVRTPGVYALGVLYAGGIDFRRFRTPSLPISGVILGYSKGRRCRSCARH